MNPQRKSNKKIPLRDLCQTPRYGIEPIHDLLGECSHVWECASGEDNLARAMELQGVHVIKTDISFGYDFLKMDYGFIRFKFDAIVTNPPFSLVKEFTNQALTLCKRVALLMPTQIVSTKWFQEATVKFGQPGIVWFNPRIDFKMPNKGWEGKGSHFPTAWFTWGWFEGNRFVRMDDWTGEYKRKNSE